MIKFGKQSKANLAEMTEEWQEVLIDAALHTPAEHDWSITEAHRPVSRQKKLFDEGRTQIDGINKKGTHNYWPSKGVDAYPYLKSFGTLIPNVQCYKKLLKFNGLPITDENIHRAEKFVITKMSVVSGIILSSAIRKGVDIVWGTDWDRDGNMLDHNFQDYPHHQLNMKGE